MGSNFISEPMDFTYKEGKAVDFRKTFDLTGNDNDQMLRLYLSRAGLSDNIDHLTPQQRKAFIYDIVKSNKNPGYWRPSVLPQAPPATMPPKKNLSVDTRIDPIASDNIPSIDDIPPASTTFNYNHFSQINSVPSDRDRDTSHQQAVRGTLYERQMQQQKMNSPKIYNAPPTPPSPSTFVTRKGLKIEISGPINFQHVSGDMTRDMSKNAFDLSNQFNDKSLKKYMIERGITEDDIAGMDSRELIKKIVQSKYTWTPIRKQYAGNTIPPPPSEVYMAPSPPVRNREHNKGIPLKVSAPRIPSETSSQEEIYLEILPPDSRYGTQRGAAPPPPSMNSFNLNKGTMSSRPKRPPTPPPLAPQAPQAPTKPVRKTEQVLPPPPPMMVASASIPTPPPPPALTMLPTKSKSNGGVPPPPPPPPPALTKQQPSVSAASGGIPPPPPPPAPIKQQPTVSNASGGAHPPPPPAPPKVQPIATTSNGAMPPPPPPPNFALPVAPVASKSESSRKPEASGDNRDAFLESIRAGVSLKKVNKENRARPGLGNIIDPPSNPPAATGTVKHKPAKAEPQDFMSELRNATLKRIKKLENNPYAGEESESHC